MKIAVDEVALFGTEKLHIIKPPKPIARISLCGALTFTITDDMTFNCPTKEQIKNLKEAFNIEVEILDEYEQLRTENN